MDWGRDVRVAVFDEGVIEVVLRAAEDNDNGDDEDEGVVLAVVDVDVAVDEDDVDGDACNWAWGQLDGFLSDDSIFVFLKFG